MQPIDESAAALMRKSSWHRLHHRCLKIVYTHSPDVRQVHAHHVLGAVTFLELGHTLVAHDDTGHGRLGRCATEHRRFLGRRECGVKHGDVIGRAAVRLRDLIEKEPRAFGVGHGLLVLQQLDDHALVRVRIREDLLVVGHLAERARDIQKWLAHQWIHKETTYRLHCCSLLT